MDGELAGVEHRQIHQHLGMCQDCRSEYDDLLLTKRMLAGLKLQAPRPELPGMIGQRIAAEASPVHRSISWIDAAIDWWNGASRMQHTLAYGGVAIAATLFYIGHAQPTGAGEYTGIQLLPAGAATAPLPPAPAPDDGIAMRGPDPDQLFRNAVLGSPVVAVSDRFPFTDRRPEPGPSYQQPPLEAWFVRQRR